MCIKQLPALNSFIVRGRRGSAARRAGFALYMVLVLMALLAVLLVGLSRRTIAWSQHAGRVRQELQYRWGERTLRAALLARPGELLWVNRQAASTVAGTEPAANALRDEVRLGDTSHAITLADESTKINLNQQHAAGGVSDVMNILYQYVREQRYLRPIVLLPQDGSMAAQRYRSFGQVLLLDRFTTVGSVAAWLPEHTSSITCWGDGKLNIRLAEEETVYAVCQKLAAARTIRKLLALRQDEDFAQWELNEILDKLELRASERVKLRAWLSTESTAHSLWLEARSARRTRLSLTVAERNRAGSWDQIHFVW